MSEEELWEWMMGDKLRRRANATLTKDIVMDVWTGEHGNVGPIMVQMPVAAGTRVRCVMASRFGDVGITTDLTASSGYHYRTNCTSGYLNGQPIQPDGLLVDIEADAPKGTP